MSIIIEKTYKLLDTLDNSKLIRDLKKYKQKLLQHPQALSLIKEYNQTTNLETKLTIKKVLYQIPEYTKYIELYNELSLIIFQINKKYQMFTNTKKCHHQD